MANPQPDEFTRIANELYLAIMRTNFTKRQRKILDLIIRMSYGCRKKSALLKPGDFGIVGVGQNHIREELNQLVGAKILMIDGERFTLIKDYDQWQIKQVSGFDAKKFTSILHRNIKDIRTAGMQKGFVLKGEAGIPQNRFGLHPETGGISLHKASINDVGELSIENKEKLKDITFKGDVSNGHSDSCQSSSRANWRENRAIRKAFFTS